MKKKYKVTAIIFAVVFCTLLGCERKEKGAGELLLPVQSGENASDDTGGPAAADDPDQETGAPGTGSEVVFGESYTAQTGADSGSQMRAGAGAEPSGTAQSGTVSAGWSAQSGKDAVTADGDFMAKGGSCVVHVCGEVKEPGVYVMDEGSRIYQAIEKAGGFGQDADENYLNQADLLSDGMKIYVPTKAEVEEAGGEIEWKTFGNSGIETSVEAGAKDDTAKSGALVNINTAGEAQLTTLPGVGSSKAKSIIAYREQNGAYQKIEDIMNVEGIKDGVFQKIKDSITV